MPKKKDPRMRALEQQATTANPTTANASGGTKYFDSAEYEVQKQRAKNAEAREALREAAGKAVHVTGTPTKSV
jgi:hypothetical protein